MSSPKWHEWHGDIGRAACLGSDTARAGHLPLPPDAVPAHLHAAWQAGYDYGAAHSPIPSDDEASTAHRDARCSACGLGVLVAGPSGKHECYSVDPPARIYRPVADPRDINEPSNAVLALAQAATRHRLPKRRRKVTHELRIGGHRVHVTVGLYADGAPGEVFLDMSKDGSAMRHFANGFAIAFSLLLQHGVPVDDIAHAFEMLSGGPCGDVEGHDTIKSARSIIDLVAQLLRAEHGEKR